MCDDHGGLLTSIDLSREGQDFNSCNAMYLDAIPSLLLAVFCGMCRM